MTITDLMKLHGDGMTWQPIEKAPKERVIWTKIDDGKGVRNVQKLKRVKGLWFVPGGQTYVYYSPTHWAPDAPSPPEQSK